MDQVIVSTLSAEYIYRLIAERAEKRALLERLPNELSDLEKLIDAALLFAPPGFDPSKRASPTAVAPAESQATPPVVAPKRTDVGMVKVIPRAKTKTFPAGKIGWGKAILSILQSAGRGFTHKEVIALARQRYPLPVAREGEEKAYYNAVSKLTVAGEVVKHGNLLYAASAFRAAEKSGLLPEVSSLIRRPGSSPELVMQLLREHPEGLTGPQMREIFGGMPHAPKSLFGHGQYIYNILAPMIGIGEVVRSEGGIYRLADGGPK